MAKFTTPNYTQVPNVLLDDLMAELTDIELRTLLSICRLTFGFHRSKVRRSLTKLSASSGISRPSTIKALGLLQERGLIYKKKDGGVVQYSICMEDSYTKADTPNEISKASPEVPTFKGNTQKKVVEREDKKTWALASALASVVGMELELNKGQLLGIAKRLIKAGKSVEQLNALFGEGGIWYTKDWRGLSGSKPRASQILSEWARMEEMDGISSKSVTVVEGAIYG